MNAESLRKKHGQRSSAQPARPPVNGGVVDFEASFPSLMSSNDRQDVSYDVQGGTSNSSIITEIIDLPAADKSHLRHNMSDVIKRVQSTTNTVIDVSTARRTGITTFLVKGRPNDVAHARREIARSFAQKVGVYACIDACRRAWLFTCPWLCWV
jgi:hypothetical protein